MIKHDLEKLLGSYIPSFFTMNIHTRKESEDLNKFSETGKATIAHEYIHFLQDITTTFGVMNSIRIGDIIKTYSQMTHESSSTEVQIPFNLPLTISLLRMSSCTNSFTDNKLQLDCSMSKKLR